METIYYNIHTTIKENNQLQNSFDVTLILYDLFIVLSKMGYYTWIQTGIPIKNGENENGRKNTHTTVQFSHLSEMKRKNKTTRVSINTNSNFSRQK